MAGTSVRVCKVSRRKNSMSVDELLTSLEALAREEDEKVVEAPDVPRKEMSHTAASSQLRNAQDESVDLRPGSRASMAASFLGQKSNEEYEGGALQDYFSDGLSSVGIGSSKAAEVYEALAVEKRKSKRLQKENTDLRKKVDRERALRVSAESTAKTFEKEREQFARTLEVLLGLLRDANDVIAKQTERISSFESQHSVAPGFHSYMDRELPPRTSPSAVTGGSFLRGKTPANTSLLDEESRTKSVSIQELESQLNAVRTQLELSEGRRHAAELELQSMQYENRARRPINHY